MANPEGPTITPITKDEIAEVQARNRRASTTLRNLYAIPMVTLQDLNQSEVAAENRGLIEGAFIDAPRYAEALDRIGWPVQTIKKNALASAQSAKRTATLHSINVVITAALVSTILEDRIASVKDLSTIESTREVELLKSGVIPLPQIAENLRGLRKKLPQTLDPKAENSSHPAYNLNPEGLIALSALCLSSDMAQRDAAEGLLKDHDTYGLRLYLTNPDFFKPNFSVGETETMELMNATPLTPAFTLYTGGKK